MSWGSTEATLEDLQASLPHQPTVPKHPAIPRVIYVQKIQFYPYVKSAIFLASQFKNKNLKTVKNECFRLIHFQLYVQCSNLDGDATFLLWIRFSLPGSNNVVLVGFNNGGC